MGPRSVIDYALARRAALADLRAGRMSRLDVCDANPYLLRAARYHGEPTGRSCPVCHAGGDGPDPGTRGLAEPPRRHQTGPRPAGSAQDGSAERAGAQRAGLVNVTYGYGDELGDSSGRAWGSGDLPELADRFSELRIYVVEVCAACGWNYLVTSYTIGTGGPPVRRRRAAPET
jgi:hypothetical protein